jgi:DNA polymerase-3 subunit beta
MNKHALSTKQFVSLEGRALRDAMKLMTAIVERRNTYPILANVCLSVAGSVLTVTGTDLDIDASTELDVIAAEGDWSVCINARILAAISRVAGPAEMRIERVERVRASSSRDATQTEVIASISIGGDAFYELGALDPEGFPSMGGVTGELLERFAGGSLATTLDKVAWCISTEETRYYLNGVAWQATASGRRLVATDGHKLALCRYSDEPAARPIARIIPRKTVQILRRFTAGIDVAVHARVKPNELGELVESEGVVDFVFGRTRMRAKMIEGTFPDVDRVIPSAQQAARQFTFQRDVMADALGKIGGVPGDRHGVATRFSEAAGEIWLDAKSAEYGSSRVRVPGSVWADDATDFGLNGSYFAALLGSCSGPVTMRMGDAGSPILVSDDDATMTRVIMPMRV